MNKIFKGIIKKLALKNYIIFESVPDLSDNTKKVFDEMLLRNLNQKYKMVWVVSDKNKKYQQYPNTIYIDKKTRLHRLEYYWYVLRAKCLVCCNRFLTTSRKGQTSFYLTHGTAIKSVRSYYNLPKEIDYLLVSSESVKEMMSYELKFSMDKTYGLGLPRNDVFNLDKKDLHNYFSVDFKKIIIWYPTFRQHKNGIHTGSSNALPIIHDIQKAKEINDFLKENDIVIAIKPHFAQDISYIKDNQLSNIIFIDDSFFVDNEITSYEFIGASDALITDYSSIYFDYLLCNKPVAAVWEDIEEYKENPGFAIDVETYMSGARKIYSLEDFKHFISEVSENLDLLKEERQKNSEWANYSCDGKNAERVTNFIVEKAKL